MQGLTSLFGMGRGVHLIYNHQKYRDRSMFSTLIRHTRKKAMRKDFGLLVLLGFDITAFTPVTYRGRNLQPPYKEISS